MLSICLKSDSVRIYIIVSCLSFTSKSTFSEHFVSWHFLLKYMKEYSSVLYLKGRKCHYGDHLTNTVLGLFSLSAFNLQMQYY